MKGRCISHDGIHVYPEYCELSLQQLLSISKDKEGIVIGSLPVGNLNEVFAVFRGATLYMRAKYRVPSMESDVVPGVEKPEVAELVNKNVLILICYEIMFPEDYIIQKQKIDAIVHMVGFPMYSEEQKEGWVAMQKALSLIYNCPLICSCGGVGGEMNISGVMLPEKLR